jgi:hypothetical protein
MALADAARANLGGWRGRGVGTLKEAAVDGHPLTNQYILIGCFDVMEPSLEPKP